MVCRYVFVLLEKNKDLAFSGDVATYFVLTQLYSEVQALLANQKENSGLFALC